MVTRRHRPADPTVRWRRGRWGVAGAGDVTFAERMEYLGARPLSLVVPAKRERRCFEMVGDIKYLANRRRRLAGDGEAHV
jgi:hypothetical protein